MAETLTTDSTARDAVAAWNAAHKPDMLVLHWPGGDRSQPARADVALRGAWLAGTPAEAMIYLQSLFNAVPLGHVAPHPDHATISAMPKPATEFLEFPLPPCPYCGVDCDVDDVFRCPECEASWSDITPHLDEGIRLCVECDHQAEVLDGDGQPRCRPCVANTRAGLAEPTGPYDCTSCTRQGVTGIGRNRGAYKARQCGECHHLAERRTRFERLGVR